MNHEPPSSDILPIQPRTEVPGQDPLINPGYHPVPQDLPPTQEPSQPDHDNEPHPDRPPTPHPEKGKTV